MATEIGSWLFPDFHASRLGPMAEADGPKAALKRADHRRCCRHHRLKPVALKKGALKRAVARRQLNTTKSV